MSYSVESKCGACTKYETCADIAFIRGAVQGIHSAPRGMNDNSWHQGSGTITLQCHNYIQKGEQNDNPQA